MQRKFLRVIKTTLFIVGVWGALSTSLQAMLEPEEKDDTRNAGVVRKALPPQENSFKTLALSIVVAAESHFKSLLGTAPTPKAPLRRIQSDVPPIATGHEEIYRRFCKGVITYTNSQTNQTIECPISTLDNPLKGTVCGIDFISIHTGFWEKVKDEETPSFSLQIWIVPHFLIEETLKKSNWLEKTFCGSSASHFQSILPHWDGKAAPIGVFFTSGLQKSLEEFEYLTTISLSDLGKDNLSTQHSKAQKMGEGYETLSRLLSQFRVSFPEPE